MPRLSLLAVLLAGPAFGQDAFPPPKSLGPVDTYGRNLQRSMRLLAASTPEKRNTVRVLFYGQSITEQHWWKLVADDLRKRFPYADLVVVNRAIGGHSSQLLVKTAEADLYPFYPDLLIFHVYGAHDKYEDIIRRVRERTTADILQANDHFAAGDAIDEPTDGDKLTPKQWNPWMNHSFLPGVAKKYATDLCDVRAVWKQYLRDYDLTPQALLKDGVHLNDRGCFLMAEVVKSYLRYDPKFDAPDDRVTTYTVGKDIDWNGEKLALDFDGNRVDLICKPGSAPPAAVRIDGKKPSECPECYANTRTTAYPRSNWPVLLRVSAEAPRAAEDWTLTITEADPEMKNVKFRVVGSETGYDGEGESSQRFASKSGRVVIEPDDWNLGYALKVFKRPLPVPFEVKWKTVLLGRDEFVSPDVKDPAVEAAVTVAQRLPNGKHRLEVSGGPVAAVRAYRPAGGRVN